MTRLSEWVKSIARGWVVIVLLALFMLTTMVVFPLFSRMLQVPKEGVEAIDTQLGYTPARLYEIMEDYGETGRRGYAISHLTADLIFPLVYTFFFGTAISYTFRRAFSPHSALQRLNLVPFGLFTVDLVENSLLVILLLSFPARLEGLAWAAGVVTAVKWMFSTAVVLLVLVGLVGWAVAAVKKWQGKGQAQE